MSCLQSIEICKLKGACGDSPLQIEFDQHKKITMIYGENGTGKTTIVDAFDVVCNERIGSLEDISVDGRKESYLSSVNSKKRDLKVHLHFNSQIWETGIGYRNKPATGGLQERPSARILRRNILLDFITPQPNKKYERFQEFINVPICERVEASLRDLLKTKKREYDSSVIMLTQAEEQLKTLWEKEGKAEKNENDWAKKITEKKTVELELEVNTLKELLDTLQKYNTTKSSLIGELENYKSNQEAHEAISIEYDRIKSTIEKNADDLLKVLEYSKEYISKEKSISECPVCKSRINRDSVLTELDTRINIFKDFRRVLKEKEAYETKIKTNIIQIEKAYGILAQVFNELNDRLAVATKKGYVQFSIDYKCPPFDMEKVESVIQSIEVSLKPVAAIEETHNEKSAKYHKINSVQTLLDTIANNFKASQELYTTTKKIESVIPILEAERQKYIDTILAEISSSVDKLFARIHPDENIGGVEWTLTKGKKGSIDLKGRFETESDIPPQAYYSEAHLDTLGICIFLALSEYYGDKKTIIILDDVFTSVDQSHTRRFMDVLNDVAGKFDKMILTTHYRPWRDSYKFAREASKHIQFIELLPWRFDYGIRHSKTKMSIDELSDCISASCPDRQIIASKAGILLENLLDFLVRQYQLPIRLKSDFMLGDFESSLVNKRGKFMKIVDCGKGKAEYSIYDSLIKVFELKWIRDKIGCHFNVAGQEIADSEVTEFGKRTSEFAQIMICDKCGELPHRDKSGSYYECKCSMRQLHPLIIPD